MDQEAGPILVMSREGSIRVLLAGLIRDEGDEPATTASVAELWSHPDLDRARLLVIEAVAWDEQILDLLGMLEARPSRPRVALVFSARTASLRLHPAVGYSLFTPCPAAKLREFVRAICTAGMDRRSRVSGVRQRESRIGEAVLFEIKSRGRG